MLLKKYLMLWINKIASIALLMGCGLSVADASCTATLCRERGHGYECHAEEDSPEWICRQSRTIEAEAKAKAEAAEIECRSELCQAKLKAEAVTITSQVQFYIWGQRWRYFGEHKNEVSATKG